MEQSIKLLYLAVATLFLLIALTAFYANEEKFIKFYNAQEALRKENGWLKEQQEVTEIERKIALSEPVLALQNDQQYSYIFFEGKELKVQIYGIILEQVQLLKQMTGRELPSRLTEAMTSEELLGVTLHMTIDGLVLMPSTIQSAIDSIEDNGIYALRYEDDFSKYVIKTLE
jgi:hypothetical protein